jgi:hypothetical protein
MKYRPLQTVTGGLPILVAATSESADGIYFLPNGETQNVRLLRRDEGKLRRAKKEALDGHYALTKLRSAAIEKDGSALAEASRELNRGAGGLPQSSPLPRIGKSLAPTGIRRG